MALESKTTCFIHRKINKLRKFINKLIFFLFVVTRFLSLSLSLEARHHNIIFPVFFLCSHSYELTFGISMKYLNKAQRLLYGGSLMTHAMVFTGFSWEVRIVCSRLSVRKTAAR